MKAAATNPPGSGSWTNLENNQAYAGAYLGFKSTGDLHLWLDSAEFQAVYMPFRDARAAGISVKGNSESSQ